MRQKRWLELLKDYDCTIECHSGKANVVADALGRKVSGRVANLLTLRKMNVEVQVSPGGVLLATLKIRPVLHERIRQAQNREDYIIELRKKMDQGKR